jgi:hypothetical protein
MQRLVKRVMVSGTYRRMIFRNMMLSLVFAGVGRRAQTGRGPALHTPDVSLDREVTLLWAPGATEVAVTSIGQRLPDLYRYAFSVDGANFNHPGAPLFKGSIGSAGQSTRR